MTFNQTIKIQLKLNRKTKKQFCDNIFAKNSKAQRPLSIVDDEGYNEILSKIDP
jgi:hypothetical protein